MVKITYDENDLEQVKLIDDYFWYKYFCEVVRSDWNKFYEENRLNPRLYQIISSHLNRYELERAYQIHKNFSKFSKFSVFWVLDSILSCRPGKV